MRVGAEPSEQSPPGQAAGTFLRETTLPRSRQHLEARGFPDPRKFLPLIRSVRQQCRQTEQLNTTALSVESSLIFLPCSDFNLRLNERSHARNRWPAEPIPRPYAIASICCTVLPSSGKLDVHRV